MINSFWNICSSCPMPKEEKLNSEYKRNYVWHPVYRPVPQDVVCVPPQSASKEMGFQRKKQYPDLAYRTSEVITSQNTSHGKEPNDMRTRSEERGADGALKSGPRSRSAEPGVGRQHQKAVMIQSYPPVTSSKGALVSKMEDLPGLVEVVQKSTEYRSQFAWPQQSARGFCTARKSVSMGLIKAPDQPDNVVTERPKPIQEVTVHKATVKEVPVSAEKPPQDSKKKVKTEYKAKYKPFTSYVYIDGQWKKTSRLVKIPENQGEVNLHPWYSEVMERLQRANEYKCRGHGHPVYGEQLPSIYMKQTEGVPLVRPKKDLPEIPISTISLESKKSDVKKKKERKEKSSVSADRKIEKEKKKTAETKRPKSAEPAKSRKPKVHQRPQTAPPPPVKEVPAPVPAHHAYARKSAAKAAEVETRSKSAAKSLTSRKQKVDSSRSGLPPDGRASRTAHRASPTSTEKVWLQAGAPVESSLDSFKGKHSDAVRPSVLLPPPPPKSDLESPDDKAQPVQPNGNEKVEFSQAPSAPVPLTHVQTPEEVTGVKSPEPENWTVPLDKGKKLQWTESSTAEPLLPQAKPSPPKSESTEKGKIIGKIIPDVSGPSKPVPSTAITNPESPASAQTTARMTTADVLERARSRLDQFWGKK